MTLGELATLTTLKTGIEQAWKWRRGKAQKRTCKKN